MKKYLAIILGVILIFTIMPTNVYSATRPSTDITISNYSTTPAKIYEGKTFTLSLTLKNNSGIEGSKINNIFITVNPSDSFAVAGSGSTIPVTDSWRNENGSEILTKDINLIYTGGTNRSLSLTIKADFKINDTTTESFTATDYVNINIVPTPDDSGGIDFDPYEFVPKLEVLNKKMPTAVAGESFKLSLDIVNNSIVTAQDITITPVYNGEGSGPFMIDTLKQSVHIDRIDGNKSKNIELNYKIDPKTPSGIYELTLNYSYYNDLGAAKPFTSSETIRIKIENNKNEPQLNISKIQYPNNGIQAGSTVPVKFNLVNKGNQKLADVKITLEGLKTGGFTIEGNGFTSTLGTFSPNQEKQATFNITAAEGMTDGSHDLTVKMEYRDEFSNVYTESYTVFLPVSRSASNYGLQIQNLKEPSGTFGQNEDIPISFNLVNTGDTKLYKVKVTLNGETGLIPKSPAIKTFNVIEPGKSETLNFTFAARADAETRNHPIAIQVEYQVGPNAGDVESFVQYVGVNIKNDGAGSSGSLPKIIIDSYSTDPTIVRAGSNFNLKISFHNTNRDKTVKNIKVTFTAPSETQSGSVFTPVNSSNTFYIESIGPKESVEMERVFFTIPDAQPKTYTIIANFEYEYDGLEGSPVTAQEQFGIPVVQQSRLETSVINMPTNTFLGQPIPLSFEFYNMGKVTLYNLMITVEGDFTSQTPNYFVGNFEPGYSDYFDTMLTPNSVGQLTGAVVFEYDDAAGEHQEIRKEFTTFVEEMPVDVYNPDFPGGFPGEIPMEPMPEETTGIMKYIKSPVTWIVVGVLVIGAITAVIVIKRRKLRKEMMLDE